MDDVHFDKDLEARVQSDLVQLKKCVGKTDFMEYFNLGIQFVGRYAHLPDCFLHNIEILKNCLSFTKSNTEKYHLMYIDVVNWFGILSFYCHNNIIGINFYYIALLRSKLGDKSMFYHNIADSLLSIDKLDLARTYFKKAIIDIPSKEILASRGLNVPELFNLYRLNHVKCLIKLNKIQLANEEFLTVKESKIIDKRFKAYYKYIKMCLVICGDIDGVKEVEVLAIKKYLKDQFNFTDVIDINNLILEKMPQWEYIDKEVLLLENCELSNNIHNVETKRKALIELIKYYEENNNKEREYFYLKKLYLVDSQKTIEFSSKLIEIYLGEFLDFFSELKSINKLVTDQKDELKDITYILSHDLKTPLRTIMNFSELINNGILDNKLENIKSYFPLIQESSEYLYRLIEDVSSLHNVDKNNISNDLVDLNELVGVIIKNFDVVIKDKNAKVIIEEKLPVISSNNSLLMLLFQNLIENGLKYNKSDRPEVRVSYFIKNDNIQIDFVDNGIGIEEKYFEKIFMFFKRLHVNKDYEGTGFGLGICKKIASKLQGEILIKSEIDKGSTFSVLLPVGKIDVKF